MKIYDVLKNKCSNHISAIYEKVMFLESEGIREIEPHIRKILLTKNQSEIITNEFMTESPISFKAVFETLIFVNSIDKRICYKWAFETSRGDDRQLQYFVESMLTYPNEIITKEGRTAGRVAFELIRKKAVLNKVESKILS